MNAVEGSRPSAPIAGLEPEHLLALAAVVAALFFGAAGLIGAVGYLISVTRSR